MITNKTIYQHAILRSLKKSGSGQTTGTAQGAMASFSTNTVKPIVSGIFGVNYNENGVTGMNITRCGKNFWSGSNTISKDNTQPYTVVPCFLKAGTYTVSGNITSDTDGVRLYFRSGTTALIPLNISTATGYGTVTLTSDVTEFRFFGQQSNTGSNAASIANLLIEEGSAPSTYEAYSGDTYPVSFGDTIYGGTFNSVTGILTSTLDSDGTPLETPVEIELTSIEINTLDGINNIFCDTGDSDISYIVNGASKKDKVLSYLPLIYGRKELL